MCTTELKGKVSMEMLPIYFVTKILLIHELELVNLLTFQNENCSFSLSQLRIIIQALVLELYHVLHRKI